MQLKRSPKMPLEVVVLCQPSCSFGPGAGPRLSLFSCLQRQAGRGGGRVLAPAHPKVGVDELGRGGHIDVADAEPGELLLETLKVRGRSARTAQSEVELSQGAGRP